MKNKIYNAVALGGTFDLFHKGHREFLQFALNNSKKLIIGITSEEYTQKLKPSVIDPLPVRKKNVEDFLKKHALFEQIELITIDNVFGPTLNKNFKIDALFVTEESKAGAQIINTGRLKRNLNKFPVIIFPFVLSLDGKIISSSRIRNGEINREGGLYYDPVWLTSNIVLPESLRTELKKPMGELLKDEKSVQQIDSSCVITVGDAVTKSFNDLSYKQRFSAVDFYIKREEKFRDIKELGFCGKELVIENVNPAGSITSSLMKSILNIFSSSNIKERVIFKIKGEEDLAVLPFLIAAPLGFNIFYGQPSQGIVRVEVTEEAKQKAYDLLSRFELNNR